jgi:maleate isomerase
MSPDWGTGPADRLISVGVLTPHAAIGPEEELPAMTSGRVTTRVARTTTREAGTDPRSPVDLRALTTAPLLDRAAELLARESIDAIGYASTSSAYAVGFDNETAVVSGLSQRSGLPVVATCASAVFALRLLGIERVALVHPPWFDTELNELGCSYFGSQGLEVVMSASAQLSRDPNSIEPDAVIEWTSRHVADDADAVFIGGNGFRAAGAIEPLELALGRPVLQSNQVLLWSVLAHPASR